MSELAASLGFIIAQTDDQGAIAAVIAFLFGGIGLLFMLTIAVLLIVGMWKMFTKASEPGWASLIPLYNVVVLLRIVGRPGWWLLLSFVPFVNIIVAIVVMMDLAKSFGKSTGFAVGLIVLSPIFMAMLGFDDSQYIGPGATLQPSPVA